MTSIDVMGQLGIDLAEASSEDLAAMAKALRNAEQRIRYALADRAGLPAVFEQDGIEWHVVSPPIFARTPGVQR